MQLENAKDHEIHLKNENEELQAKMKVLQRNLAEIKSWAATDHYQHEAYAEELKIRGGIKEIDFEQVYDIMDKNQVMGQGDWVKEILN